MIWKLTGYLGLTTYPEKFVECVCKNCKIECRVEFSALIEINTAHKDMTAALRPRIISHERRHVMSRAMGVNTRVVIPLEAEPVIEYDDMESCDEASLAMQIRYEDILIDYFENHKNHTGDSGANKWSPDASTGYDPLTQEDIDDWMFNDI